MVIGVTGGIGSGKTYICKLLEIASLPVFYCDDEAKRLMNSDPDVKQSIVELFGDEAYIEVTHLDEKSKGSEENQETEVTLNKELISSKIFSDPTLRKKMNDIVHPAVLTAFEKWRQEQESNVTVIESALLFETGYDQKSDLIVVVSAPMELRIKRLKKRDKMSEQEIEKRINAQMDESTKLRKADVIITNSLRDDLNTQIFKLLETIKGELFTAKPTPPLTATPNPPLTTTQTPPTNR